MSHESPNTENRNRIRQLIAENVAEQLRKAYEKNCIRYNQRARRFEYNVNDVIYHRNMKLSNAANQFSAKLRPKFIKCTVIERMGSNTYKVRDSDGKHVGVYHTTQLRK